MTGSSSENERRTLVLVIGMHRSGTSTVAGALGILGATMPATGLGLSDDNPKGHFEPKEIVALHDRVLASAGMHWWDWAAFPDTWYDTPAAQPFVDELVDIVQAEFGDAPLFVVKDPRTCQLVALWRRVAAVLNLKVVAVLPFRHPDEVARSLHTRDRFPLPNTHMAWLRYVLEAERGSRGLRRIVLRYEDLLADPRGQMQRVVEGLALPLNADDPALDGFVDPDLRRARAESTGIEHLHEWLRDTVTAYARGTAQGPDGSAQGPDSAVVDRVHAAFGTACSAFIPALDATNRGFEEAHRLNRLIPGVQAERDAALATAREAEARASAAAAEVPNLRADLRARDERIGALEAELRTIEVREAAPRRWWQRA